MANFLDLTGKKFGRLEVISFSRDIKSGNRTRKYWNCKCCCGNYKEVRTDSLTSGNVKSCGCLKVEQDNKNLTDKYQFKPKYEIQNRRIYNIWRGMINRCYCHDDKRYSRYGNRNIIICDEWMDYNTFAKWSLNNGYSDNLTIDRINNNGNYEPSNCRWASIQEQCRNRSTNVSIEYKGETIALVELSEITGLTYSCIHSRYQRGKRGYELWKPVNSKYRKNK